MMFDQRGNRFYYLGSYQSGQLGLTVNQLRKLREFESLTAHQIRKRGSGVLPEGSIGTYVISRFGLGSSCRNALRSPFGIETGIETELTCPCGAAVAHSLGKTGVMGSIPITGSLNCRVVCD
jgi:hypothetical protein